MGIRNLILEVRFIDEVCWILKIYMLDDDKSDELANCENQTLINQDKIYKTF